MYGLHGALQVPCNGRAQLQHVKFLLRDALVKDTSAALASFAFGQCHQRFKNSL